MSNPYCNVHFPDQFLVNCWRKKNKEVNKKHHENISRFEEIFRKDIADLFEFFNCYGNLFEEEEEEGEEEEEEEEELVHFTSKILVNHQVKDSVENAHSIGNEQHKHFYKKRVSLYNTIKRKKMPIFRKENGVRASKKKQEVTTLKERANLFRDIYIGCQIRGSDLSTFFFP